MFSVVEKAQHEPHWPWSLTGVTVFLTLRQSNLRGRCSTRYVVRSASVSWAEGEGAGL